MGIRVHHEALPGTNVYELSRAAGSSRSAENGRKPVSGLGSRDCDEVEISSLSGGITELSQMQRVRDGIDTVLPGQFDRSLPQRLR
jgi:hypothetical protein